MANAAVHYNTNLKRQLIRLLEANHHRRREMMKDAITRQVIDEEVGEDDFFTVQVQIKDTRTAARDITSYIEKRGTVHQSYMISLTKQERTTVEIPPTATK